MKMDTLTSRLSLPATKHLIADLKQIKEISNPTAIPDLHWWRTTRAASGHLEEFSLVWLQGTICQVSNIPSVSCIHLVHMEI